MIVRRLIMSISIYKSRLIDNMTSDRSQMFVFIIGSPGAPHGKSNLNPCVGKTSESMIRFFALITFLDISSSSPVTGSD